MTTVENYDNMNILDKIEYLKNEGMSEDHAGRIVNFENGGNYDD